MVRDRGDCCSELAKISRVDHVISDPPFETEAHTKQRRSLKDATQKRGAVNKGEVRRIESTLSFPAISESDRALVSREFGRMAARWTVLFCQIEAIWSWRQVLVTGGLDWVRGGVWLKPNGMPQFTGDRPGQGFESLAIAHAPGRKRWNGGGRHAVWTCNLDHHAGAGGQNIHPTKKPELLMLELVKDFTDLNEVILDPFCGSGTTGIAALRLGRRFIGVERDPSFAALSRDRLAAEEQCSTLEALRMGQGALFG